MRAVGTHRDGFLGVLQPKLGQGICLVLREEQLHGGGQFFIRQVGEGGLQNAFVSLAVKTRGLQADHKILACDGLRGEGTEIRLLREHKAQYVPRGEALRQEEADEPFSVDER